MGLIKKDRFKRLSIFIWDVISVLAAYWVAFLLRFDFHVGQPWVSHFWATLPMVLVANLAAFYYFGLYRCVWRYASLSDAISIIKSIAVGQVVASAIVLFLHHGEFPRSVLLIQPLIGTGMIGAARLWIRLSRSWRWPRSGEDEIRTVIVGDEDLADHAMHALRQMKHRRVVGFISDQPHLWGHRINNVPVLGGPQVLPSVIQKLSVSEVILTVPPTRRGAVLGELITLCRRDGLPQVAFRVVPGLHEVLSAAVPEPEIRRVEPADLLNRQEVRMDQILVRSKIQGCRMLVTGAGGTIGGELCRQIAMYEPASLVLVENNATNLFYIERKLTGVKTPVVPLLADIRDSALVNGIFRRHRPQVIFHAAAHKHVAQLETNITEGIKNNILGTYTLARAAEAHGVEKFVLISTDKAVEPTSAMGATKRAAERIMQTLSTQSSCQFLSVRFGNVLGSSGSVVKLFKEQIERGGPVTVTHPEVTRYFMTVQEAVELILEAFARAGGGETFILRMGSPIRILDMATKLILLKGLEPGRDIAIEFTGLKAGEKLHEKLTEDSEMVIPCDHRHLMVLRSQPPIPETLHEEIEQLRRLAFENDEPPLIAKLQEMVPTYQPAGRPMLTEQPA